MEPSKLLVKMIYLKIFQNMQRNYLQAETKINKIIKKINVFKVIIMKICNYENIPGRIQISQATFDLINQLDF